SENGVKNKNCCTDITIIYARGTSESGNVGSVSGPPMFKALRQKLGANRVTVQGVDYPATSGVSSYGAACISSGGGTGPVQMASDVRTVLQQCPQTKVVVSGYSQGGMVVHRAFSAQGLSSSQVTGAVLFGDPQIRQSVGDLPAAKVKQFCGTSDTVCGQPSGGVNGGHISYRSIADAAADFVIQVAGL
ncbi:carbohydrate esterase family 5 protein, partial [Amniculicola lignicola CBS 123094]